MHSSSRAHKVREIAPTLLFKRKFTMDQVLQADLWRSLAIFNSFYLSDITHTLLSIKYLT